jgi:hypothetical protein
MTSDSIITTIAKVHMCDARINQSVEECLPHLCVESFSENGIRKRRGVFPICEDVQLIKALKMTSQRQVLTIVSSADTMLHPTHWATVIDSNRPVGVMKYAILYQISIL